MTEQNESPQVETFDLTGPCRGFVAFKDYLDTTLTERDEGDRPHEVRSIYPATFCREALPFSEVHINPEQFVRTTIDPSLIISGSFRRHPETTHERDWEIIRRTEEIVAKNDWAHPEAPKVAQIGSLPLYVAIEGKHRVYLFRKYSQPMPAFVTPCNYPSPADLSFIRYNQLFPFIETQGLGLGDDHRILPYPIATNMMLLCYGVSSSRNIFSLFAKLREAKVEASIRRDMMSM